MEEGGGSCLHFAFKGIQSVIQYAVYLARIHFRANSRENKSAKNVEINENRSSVYTRSIFIDFHIFPHYSVIYIYNLIGAGRNPHHEKVNLLSVIKMNWIWVREN